MGTEMNADPSLMKEPSPLDERERIISICNELLCSGRPFAEVLKEIKRLSDKPTRDTVELGSSGPMIGLANDCPAPAKELPVLRERALEHGELLFRHSRANWAGRGVLVGIGLAREGA